MDYLDFTSHIWLAVYALDIYALVVAVTRGRGVDRTLAWMFAILAFPGIGALLYILLANPSVRRAKKRKRLTRAMVRHLVSMKANLPRTPENLLEESILSLTTSLTGMPPTAGNKVELLAENDYAAKRMSDAISAARRTIWAEYYIIRRDGTGSRFLDLLTEKAREGVEVRLLYDAVGSLDIDSKLLSNITEAGGKVEAFLPINPLRRRWSVHLRNHRKLIIVDGETGFTGGMNVGDEYSGSARRKGLLTFHDTHLKVRGPAVGDLAQTFAEDWSFATGETMEPIPHPPPVDEARSVVAIVPSGPDQEYNANAMVFFSGIAYARRQVFITSPYFIPDEPTLRSLISAAMRGVDVRVLVPEHSDVRLVGAAAKSYYPALLRGGVRIYEYRKSMLHAKTMAVDSTWGIVGSANVDIRSFRLNFEVGALVFDQEFAKHLKERFFRDLETSREITLGTIGKRNFVQRLAYGGVRLLSPLL